MVIYALYFLSFPVQNTLFKEELNKKYDIANSFTFPSQSDRISFSELKLILLMANYIYRVYF